MHPVGNPYRSVTTQTMKGHSRSHHMEFATHSENLSIKAGEPYLLDRCIRDEAKNKFVGEQVRNVLFLYHSLFSLHSQGFRGGCPAPGQRWWCPREAEHRPQQLAEPNILPVSRNGNLTGARLPSASQGFLDLKPRTSANLFQAAKEVSVETFILLFSRWMDKQVLVHPCDGTLYSYKKEETTDEHIHSSSSQRRHADGGKPGPESCIL